MQARFLRDDIPYVGPPELYPHETYVRKRMQNHRMGQVRCWKKGGITTHPRCFRLVQMGVCEAVDEECIERANMSPERMAAAIYAYERMNRGIHPDDFKKYDAGEMTGYNPDGSDIPGPNAETFDDVDEEEDYEEEEEEE